MKQNNKIFTPLNDVIQKVIGQWKKLNFTKLTRVYNDANVIVFSILTFDSQAYDFLRSINKLVSNKHPYGTVNFIGYDVIPDTDEVAYPYSNTTNLKKYRAIVFEEKIDDKEYIERLIIFYNDLLKLLITYSK
jgi:hypothetical protein